MTAERLTGGVSSDIWKVAVGGRVFCVKRAMAKLAVKDDWFAPVERNRYERLWYETASDRVPGIAPRVIAHDDAAMLFAMEFLDPAEHRLWKAELLAGRVDIDFAATVGRKLALIHSATAGDAAIAAIFPTGSIFEALRLEPYLRATGKRHPALQARLDALADRTAATARALVHGDISPKNILSGPAGPVFLDAECAWYGDPAFDLAFCLNHLLLKCLPRAACAARVPCRLRCACRRVFRRGRLRGPGAARSARRSRSYPAFSWRASTANRRSSTSRRSVTGSACAGSRSRFVAAPPAALAEIRNAWNRELAQ